MVHINAVPAVCRAVCPSLASAHVAAAVFGYDHLATITVDVYASEVVNSAAGCRLHRAQHEGRTAALGDREGDFRRHGGGRGMCFRPGAPSVSSHDTLQGRCRIVVLLQDRCRIVLRIGDARKLHAACGFSTSLLHTVVRTSARPAPQRRQQRANSLLTAAATGGTCCSGCFLL